MNLSTLVAETIEQHPDETASQVVARLWDKVTKSDLRPLFEQHVEHRIRHGVRRAERSAKIQQIDLLLGGQPPVINGTTSTRDQVVGLLRKVWALGDGSTVEIGEATLPEVQQRLALLRRQRDGMSETIKVLERIEAELVRTGATCLNDLIAA